jgi:phosphotransferase system  glucose/maltose/N-acetylglucosamine-specific IIC component
LAGSHQLDTFDSG